MNKMELFTIGCSTHTIEEFIRILKENSINALADVRSVPFSKFTPQFNKYNLKKELDKVGIFYVPMSEEFGARRSETHVYVNQQVDFVKTSELSKFIEGIRRIGVGLKKGYRIALMCSEKDPIDCHRFILVSRNIEKYFDVRIRHIHFDGRIEEKDAIEQRILDIVKIEMPLFNASKDELIEKAYLILGNKIAYTEQLTK